MIQVKLQNTKVKMQNGADGRTYLDPRLRGFRLIDGEYELMAAGESGGITSSELGLVLVPEDELLRLVDPTTGKPLPTEEEYVEELEAARQRAAVLALPSREHGP